MNGRKVIWDDCYVEEDYRLWLLLLQTRDIVFYLRQAELKRYGISAMQAAVLSAVQAIGREATPAEIARWMLRKPHSISGILDRMENAGLIKKTKDLHRKNMIRVVLTEEGQRAYNQSMSIKSIHRIMYALSEEERRQLGSYLVTLRDKGIKQLGMENIPFPKSQ